MNDIYKEGYFRPLSNKTPDLVTIEITSPNALNIQKSLLQVPSSNQLCPNKIYFYLLTLQIYCRYHYVSNHWGSHLN